MRHQDLAMSHLENHPEGFNALRRMYEDIQEPMMDASNPFSPGSSPAMASSPSPGASPNTAALPNPWGGSTSPATNSSPFGAGMPNLFGGMAGAGGANPFGGMGGAGMPDLNQMQSMMQNPMAQQMMQQMASNPQIIEQVSAHCNFR